MSKFFSVILSAALLAQPVAAAAQEWRATSFTVRMPAAVLPDSRLYNRAQKFPNKTYEFLHNLEKSAFVRRPDMTAYKLLEQLDYEGRVDGRILAAVLSDENYIRTLDLEAASALAYAAQFVSSCDGTSAWVERILKTVLERLGDYQENAPDFALQSFYAAVAVSLGHNAYTGRAVEDWAFKQMKRAADPMDSARRGWAAVVLADLAVPSQEDEWSLQRRERFEWRLERLIREFDWLQDAKTDYKMTGVKNVLGASNQGVLIQLFAQANSFFAMKDDDGFLKQMVSAGGLNPVGRALMSGENADPGRFSDTGENFYLHSPTPGTDGKGHFVDSVNGRRHFILSSLIQSLFLSYNTRETAESSSLMQQFVRGYLQTDRDNLFVHYLYVPLQGMRLGMAMHDTSSLDGWEKEEAALQTELYGKLKKGYPWNRICTGVQGACEVAVEWVALGKVFSWVGKGLGWGVKATGRQIVKALPPRAMLYIGVGQLAVRQGKKAVVRWSRQTVKTILRACGWKGGAAAGAAAGAGVSAPSRARRVPAR